MMALSSIIWNLGSLGFVATVGVVLSLIVGRVYGADALGIFNQVVTLYMVLSQFSAMGIHLSVLRSVALLAGGELDESAKQDIREVVWSGILVVAVLAGAISLIGVAAASGIGFVFGSTAVAEAWTWIAPGLFFFSVNKVLLNTINGLSRMRAFAVFSGGRYFLLMLFLLAFWWFGVKANLLAGIFLLAEATLLLVLVLYLSTSLVGRIDWLKIVCKSREHIVFGKKSFMSGAMAELNTRVDVLVIGIFMSDTTVGIYSIAALVFEGLSQICLVIRNLINPRIARDIAAGAQESLQLFLQRVGGMTMAGVAAASVLAIAAYPLFVDLILNDPTFHAGLIPLAILLTGLTLSSAYLPLDMLLVLANRPGIQSVFKLCVVFVNLACNLLLVPVFGMQGAAIGTAIALVSSVFILDQFSRRYVELPLLTWRISRSV